MQIFLVYLKNILYFCSRIMKKTVFLFLFGLISCSIWAKNDSIHYELAYRVNALGGMMVKDDKVDPWIDRPMLGGTFAVEFLPTGRWKSLQQWNNTSVGVGVTYINLGNDKMLGNTVALHGHLNTPFVTLPHFVFGLRPTVGLAFCDKRYSNTYQSDKYAKYSSYEGANQSIGSVVNAFLGLQLYMDFPVRDGFDITLAFGWHHISNGSIIHPNGGYNMLNGELGMRYTPGLSKARVAAGTAYQRPKTDVPHHLYDGVTKKWDVEINLGVKTGHNTAFVLTSEKRKELISSDKRSAEIIVPVLRGRDVQRYYAEQSMWLIDSHNGVKQKGIKRIAISNYPAIKKHLDTWKRELEKRGDKGDTPYNLRDCAYWDFLKREKILWGELSDNAKFVLSKCYLLNTCFFMVGEKLHYLLGVLNSKLASWYFQFICTKSGMGTVRWYKGTVEQLPVVRPDAKSEAAISDLVDQILASKAKDREADTSPLEAKIDQLVYKLYGLTEEEITIVEGRGKTAAAKDEASATPSRRRTPRPATAADSPREEDDEELE